MLTFYWKTKSDLVDHRFPRKTVDRSKPSSSILRELAEKTRRSTLQLHQIAAQQLTTDDNGTLVGGDRSTDTGGLSHSELVISVEPIELTENAKEFFDKARKTRIAIGGGLTSAIHKERVSIANMRTHMPVFRYLVPTFCKTATAGYDYHFYFAYDKNDTVFNDPNSLAHFEQLFRNELSSHCGHLKGKLDVHMIRCNHAKSPAWAQNDAMMQAYYDGMDFFYRLFIF